MTQSEAVKELRGVVHNLIDAVVILGAVAEREHDSFGDTKRSAIDLGYSALRKTNDIAKENAS